MTAIALAMRPASARADAEGPTMEGLLVEPSGMDENTFRGLYSRTAGPLRAYLTRVSGDRTLADDLLQETYYRFLRSGFDSGDHRYQKNYLYRIATNLLRDHHRRHRREVPEMPESVPVADRGEEIGLRSDVGGALGELRMRDRTMLWLAYVEGATHEEIAGVLGLRTASIRSMLSRARQRMAEALQARGIDAGDAVGRIP